MPRTRRLLAALLTCLMTVGLSPAVPSGAQEAAEPDWINLPYIYDDYEGWFRFWTNQDTFSPGVRKINATSVFETPYPGLTPEEYKPTEFQVLWGKTCQRVNPQTFITSRTLHLPGKLVDLKASLGAYSAIAKPAPIKSIQLKLNGVLVHEVVASPGNPIPFTAPGRVAVDIDQTALVHGLNEFTIVAKKRETKKKLGWCTADKYFGIVGEVFGHVRADMGLTLGDSNGSKTQWLQAVTLTNHGPSDLPAGVARFSFSAVSSQETVTDVYLTGFSEATCEENPTSNSGKTGFYIICDIPHLAPGATISSTVGASFDEASVQNGDKSDIGFYVEGYGDNYPVSNGNNGQILSVVTSDP